MQDDSDFWKMRDLLIETASITPIGFNWDVRRLEDEMMALMQEGLRRLRALGAVDVTVDTGDMAPANALYDSLGFTEAHRGYEWRKVFAA